jgi:hypothetical protein
VAGLRTPIQRLAEGHGDGGFLQLLTVWKTDLEALKVKLATVEGLAGLKDRLTGGWLEIPKAFPKSLEGLTENLNAKPDQTATLNAQTFLTAAQLRLGDYRAAMRKLDFDVNFYERGLFPPGAYHSEGHQDGMGVCLYLALMKRLFGGRFTFALLDDVMSVDAGHRYQFCKLLKTHFPDTQFIITTHDRLWAEQMKSVGLVTAKTSIAFHSWTIDTGPLVESNQEIWDEIAAALGKGKVEVAAAALRHHLEYVSRHLADQLGATPPFRADGNYELRELLPSVLVRMKSLFGKAADAAQSWGNDADKEAATKRKAALSTSAGASYVENWAINKAVHYNEWANFGKKDFAPVVAAFKELLGCFRCENCDSWVYVTPRGTPECLRCACNAIGLNLKPKSQ